MPCDNVLSANKYSPEIKQSVSTNVDTNHKLYTCSCYHHCVLPCCPQGVSLQGQVLVQVRLQVIAGVTQRPGDLGPQHLGVSAPIMGLGGAQRGQFRMTMSYV